MFVPLDEQSGCYSQFFLPGTRIQVSLVFVLGDFLLVFLVFSLEIDVNFHHFILIRFLYAVVVGTRKLSYKILSISKCLCLYIDSFPCLCLSGFLTVYFCCWNTSAWLLIIEHIKVFLFVPFDKQSGCSSLPRVRKFHRCN